MKHLPILGAALALTACAFAPPTEVAAVAAAPACSIPAGMTAPGETRLAALQDLEAAAKAAFVLTLAACLENPDPATRDGYAFEMLSAALRGGSVAPETLRPLKADLLASLAAADGDPQGFRGPFAALALAEVARTDRIAPWMSEAERSELIAAGHAFLADLTDYRGFSDTEGWRHGVAHTADLLMQLSLNPALTKPQAEAILGAVAEKAGTPDHAYVFGESERLAAPVMYLARKEIFTEDEWDTWFAGLWPAGDPLREAAYKSEAALAKLHNLRAFAEAVYVSGVASNDDIYDPLAHAAFALLKSLP